MQISKEEQVKIDKVKSRYAESLLKQPENLIQRLGICSAFSTAMPRFMREILMKVPIEIQEHYKGCGTPIPMGIEGKTVLDLGCGTGRDVYILSKIVGEKGSVIGLDMLEGSLNIAIKHVHEFSKDVLK